MQLCKPVSRPPVGDDWLHEIKFDGYRLQLRVEHGKAVMRTRAGLDWTARFAAIAEAARGLPDVILDGEAVALGRNGVSDFAALQASLSEERSDDLIYFAFDLLYEDGEDLRPLPLWERKRRLKDLLEDRARKIPNIRSVDHLDGSGDAVLQSACKMNLEGIISKWRDAPYTSGRGDTWTKAKCRAGHEIVIGGWSGGAQKMRSLLAGVYRGDHLVYVGRVGTGFNGENSRQLLRKLRAVASKTSPFSGSGVPRKHSDWTWVEPKLVAEIEFAGWTGDGMVRQAAFKGLREDKPARAVRAERPVSPVNVEVAVPKRRASVTRAPEAGSGGLTVMGIGISKPDKELWPATEATPAFTKLDLARYFEEMGPWMIDHLKGRPCSMLRAPDGIEAETFFQRHAMRGMSDLITEVTVAGDSAPYLQIDSVQALIAMGQIAAIEFHPWNCAPGKPLVPGRLVFDLDPGPDVAFDDVVAAAKELRERLEEVGLMAFCKTTGGKGLHVVTPLATQRGARQLTWTDAKTFAHAICTQMADDSPDRYLVNMSKKLRGGRIFLDYLRNDQTATAVAPLSPRARPGATVSMPLHWREVRKGLDPKRFTLATAAQLLEKRRPWADYADCGRPLEAAIKKLIGNHG
jgi:bifunctional non-homologous end joining protein LigD